MKSSHSSTNRWSGHTQIVCESFEKIFLKILNNCILSASDIIQYKRTGAAFPERNSRLIFLSHGKLVLGSITQEPIDTIKQIHTSRFTQLIYYNVVISSISHIKTYFRCQISSKVTIWAGNRLWYCHACFRNIHCLWTLLN